MFSGRPLAATARYSPPEAIVSRGFKLLELTAALACSAIVLSIAVPTYMGAMQRSRSAAAVRDLGHIAMAIQKYRLAHVMPPLSLADVGMDGLRDPWGHPYRYLSFASDEPGLN